MGLTTQDGDDIKRVVREVLHDVIHAGHDLGGMGEYGRGWNDARVQMRIIVREMIERWEIDEA